MKYFVFIFTVLEINGQDQKICEFPQLQNGKVGLSKFKSPISGSEGDCSLEDPYIKMGEIEFVLPVTFPGSVWPF